MKECPNIMGIYFGMKPDELKDIISKYNDYILVKNYEDDNSYFVKKKYNQHIVYMIFEFSSKKILINYLITDWKYFFGFTNDNITFTSIPEIFKNYFLKDFQFNIEIASDNSSLLSFCNNKWSIDFNISDEYIFLYDLDIEEID